jgi:hypothetical protein
MFFIFCYFPLLFPLVNYPRNNEHTSRLLAFVFAILSYTLHHSPWQSVPLLPQGLPWFSVPGRYVWLSSAYHVAATIPILPMLTVFYWAVKTEF